MRCTPALEATANVDILGLTCSMTTLCCLRLNVTRPINQLFVDNCYKPYIHGHFYTAIYMRSIPESIIYRHTRLDIRRREGS